MENKKNLIKLFYQGIIVVFAIGSVFVFQYLNFIPKEGKTDILDYDSPITALVPPDNSIIPGNFKAFSFKIRGILNEATLNNNTVVLKNADGAAIDGWASYDIQTQTVFFRPDQQLTSTGVTLSVNSSLKDISGRSIGPAQFSYTVKNTADTTPLTLIAVNPPNGSSGVSTLTPAMDFVFNKPLDCSDYNMDIWSAWSATTINAREEAMNASLPDIYTKCDSEAQSLHIDFGWLLWDSTIYEVTLNQGILKDMGGNVFGGYKTRFTTGPHDNIIPLQATADFNTKGFEVLFNTPIAMTNATKATNLQLYQLTCNGNLISLENANANYNVHEKRLIVTGINLVEKNNCTITVNPNFTSRGSRTFAEEDRVIRDDGRGVHKLYVGADYFESVKRTISGFRWDECANCKSTAENTAASFFNPNYISPLTNLAGEKTDYHFVTTLTRPVSNGDMLRLIFPTGFNVGAARVPNLPINKNIFSDPRNPVTLGTPVNDVANRTVDLPLNMTPNASIGANGAKIEFTISDIGNPIIASTSNTVQWKTIYVSGFMKEGPHLFNPFSIQGKGNGQITVKVLNDDTNVGIDGINLVFQGPTIGIKKLVTDATGTATLNNVPIPEGGTKSTYARVYLDEGKIPPNFSPQSGKDLSFNLNANTPTLTGNFFLQPVSSLQIRGTITHPAIPGGTKINVWTGNTTSIKKEVILSSSGTTNFTINIPKDFDVPNEGSYRLGISNFEDFNGDGKENSNIIITPAPVMLSVTSATSPVNVNFNLIQATQFIIGTVKNQGGKPIPNAHVSINSEYENNNIWMTKNTVTNIDGTYMVPVTSGKLVMEAYVKGFPHRVKKVVAIKANDTTLTTDFVLQEPTVAVSGTVKDMNSLGIKDVNVSCTNSKYDVSDVYTNDQGKYILYVYSYSGEWTCKALTAAKGYIDVVKKLAVTASSVNNVDFLEGNTIRFSRIVGKLLMNENQPYINTFITAVKYNTDNQKIIGQEYSTRTDLSGNFSLRVEENSPGEAYKVLYGGDSGAMEAANKVITGPNISDLGTIIVPRQNYLIFSATNLPANINELVLHLYVANTQTAALNTMGVFNGRADGKIRLLNGSYKLTAVAQGLVRKTLELTLAGSDKNINIDFSDIVTATLTVQVNDSATKTPLDDVFVEVVGNSNNNLFTSAKTNAGGQAVAQVAPGTYTIRASKKGFSSGVITTSADKTEQYTLELTAATSNIAGTVKDANNNPVTSAVVNGTTADKSTYVHEITDQAGNFTLQVAPNTVWNITATTLDGYFTSQNNVNAGTASLVLTANQTVSGFIRETPIMYNIDATQDHYITTKSINLEIDSNALGSNANGTNIVLKKVAAIAKTENATPVGFGLEINATDTMGNNITKSINPPIGIQINFDKDVINSMASVSGFNKKSLKGSIGYYDDIKKTWILLPTTQSVKVQMTAGGDYTTLGIDEFIASLEQLAGAYNYFVQSTAATNHLSVFALVNKEEPPPPPPPPGPIQPPGGSSGGGSSGGGSSGGGSGTVNTPTGGTTQDNTALRGASNPGTKQNGKLQVVKEKKQPTIMVNKTSAKAGDPIRILGKGSATSQIVVNISGREKITLRINTDDDGSYSYILDTTLLSLGRYGVQAQDGDLQSKKIYFIVGVQNILSEVGETIVGDLNKDGFVNLIDFSIMAYWYGKTQPTDTEEQKYYKQSDLNQDGIIDLQDFRILIINWTG